MPSAQLRHLLLLLVFSVIYIPLSGIWKEYLAFSIIKMIIIGLIILFLFGGIDIDYFIKKYTSKICMKRLFHNLLWFFILPIIGYFVFPFVNLSIAFLAYIYLLWVIHMILDFVESGIYIKYNKDKEQKKLIGLHELICGRHNPQSGDMIKYIFGGRDELKHREFKEELEKYWFSYP